VRTPIFPIIRRPQDTDAADWENVMAPQIITANRVDNGRVVYLSGDGEWSESVNDSRLIDTEEDLERLTAAADQSVKAQVVIDAYAIDAAEQDGRIEPTRYRERIRAFGPSIHPDFAKQPVPEHFEPPAGVKPITMAGD
jgi:hypothetical protein